MSRTPPPLVDDALSPYDNPLAAGVRFFTELVVWIGGTYVIWVLVNPIVAIAWFLVTVGVTSVFSTPGDKRFVLIPTPGGLRALLEILYAGLAIWVVWSLTPLVVSPEAADGGQGIASGATLVIVAGLFFGRKRLLWLFQGAPPVVD
jgi:hypothetical protein